MASNQQKGPVHEERLGRIKAVIWENNTQNGPMYNVNFCRVYRDGDQWKETTSFGRDDCLVVARLAEIVSVWIYRRQQREAAEAA